MGAHAPSREDLDALKDGAFLLLQAGNRVAALSLLWSAVAIEPTDLSAHRRLAGTLATGGDVDGAAEEFARYVEFVLPLGDVGRAASELAYGAGMLGGHPALQRAADKIAEAVRALVPPPSRALRTTTPVAAIAPAVPSAAQAPRAAPAPVSVAPPREPAATLPTPRLLPKVHFRVCLHDGGDRQWVRLEGGQRGLEPDTVRVSDGDDNVVDETPCLPLPVGGGHGSRGLLAQPTVFAVLGVRDPNKLPGRNKERLRGFTFHARVKGEWLAIELVDTPCRLAAS